VGEPTAPDLTPLPVMQLITGFWGAKTLAAAVELDLFSLLDKTGGLTRQEAAGELGLADRPADLLLAACASLGLLCKRAGSYVNSPLADAFLVPGRPYYFGGFVRFLDHREYPAWHKVVAALRTNGPVAWDPATQASLFDAEDPVMLGLFWEAMHSISTFTGRALVKALPALARHHALLDVGGAMGAIPIELCRAYPALRATVYDLPFVCDLATEKITAAGLHQRITTAPGDFLTGQALPRGHDVVMMSNVMHDWDEATGRALLAKCHDALLPGGMIVICELLLNADRTGPAEAALMGMNMMIETTGGKNHSDAEYCAWLGDTGFERIEVIRFEAAGANGVVTGRKPSGPPL
jgi:3-hydroxy-5-methyl-1-naphthoate 3-O-methyltransferase